MHGVLRLTQNELSKIYHQMSWKILTLFLLLLSAGAPVLSYYLTGASLNNLEDYYASVCSGAEEKAKACADGSVEKEYCLTLAEAYNYFMEQGFDEDSWQFYNAFGGYARNLDSLRGCQLYVEGRDIMEISDYFSIDRVDIYWDDSNTRHVVYWGSLTDEQLSDRVSPGTAWDREGEERRETDFTPEIARLIIKENEEALNNIRQYLKKPLEERVKDQMKVFEPDYEKAKKDYEAAGREFERDKSKLREYTAAKLVKESYDIFFETVSRTDFSQFEDNAQKRYLSLILEACQIVKKAGEYAPMAERDFDENGGTYYMGTYFREYVDYENAMKQRQEQHFRLLNKYCCSLEHNIPLDGYKDGGTRNAVESSLNVNLTVIILMGIFMAAVTVASEHTLGAVRLLMIRPRARWKILLSKLFCLFICMAGWITATSVVSTAANVILYGKGDLFVPYIMAGGKGMYEIAGLPYLIWKMTVNYLPGLSMVLLAFLFSALIKRSVVAMAIPMIINIFGGSASTLFIGEACRKLPLLKFTPIPYFKLSSFWADPEMQLNMFKSPLDNGLTLGMGTLMFAVYSLLLIVLSFIVFKKQQIKN